MNLRDVLAALPDDALVPVAWVRERLDVDADGDVRLADLTVEDVATEFGRASSTVRAWCGSGRLPGCYRLHGKEWRIPREAVHRMLDAERDGGAVEEIDPDAVDLGRWRTAVR